MNRTFYLLTALLIMAAGCTNNKFKKAKDGSEYRLITNSSGKKVVAGNIFELNIWAKYKDSVLFSSVEASMPRFVPYDTAQLPPFFRDIHQGDSMIIRVSTDTLIKMGQGAPFMKKGEYIYQYFKVEKIFATQAEADSVSKTFVTVAKAKAYQKTLDQVKKDLVTNAAQVKTDDQIINDYMTKNNMKAIKTEWGAYVALTNSGTGENLNQNNVAVVNYTGRTLKDSVFDSNTDPKFGHVGSINVDMSQFGVIPGWLDALKNMKKGSKGKVLIPSSLGYGKTGSGGKIGPNENLVFDIEVTDVITQAQMEEKQRMQQMQQQMQQQQMQQQMQQQQQQQQQNPQQQQPPAPNH